MQIISDTAALSRICRRLADEEFITVDTEFMREQTFWPKLCLIQLAGASDTVIIDPLAGDIDLSAFFELMRNDAVTKVFHAARQDVEIMYHLAETIPTPLFDTQIAAMVCGFGDQVGYEALVRRLAGARIDKTSRFTDWSRRPLSDKQLNYAASDVTHLRPVYEKLVAQLEKSGRAPWLSEELAVLSDPQTYQSHPEDAWKRIKFRARNRRQLAILRAVAAWREHQAQARNVPRNRIIKDDALTELAIQAPKSMDDLAALRALPRGFAASRHGAGLLDAVAEGLTAPLGDLPDPQRSRPARVEGASATADILKLALKVVCEREGIAPRLVASSSDIERIAAGESTDIPALAGWRRELFGEVALELKAGRMVIGLIDAQPAIIPATPAAAVKAAE